MLRESRESLASTGSKMKPMGTLILRVSLNGFPTDSVIISSDSIESCDSETSMTPILTDFGPLVADAGHDGRAMTEPWHETAIPMVATKPAERASGVVYCLPDSDKHCFRCVLVH